MGKDRGPRIFREEAAARFEAALHGVMGSTSVEGNSCKPLAKSAPHPYQFFLFGPNAAVDDHAHLTDRAMMEECR